eukprot:1062966-Pleurochrysis_carterae.AAC.1
MAAPPLQASAQRKQWISFRNGCSRGYQMTRRRMQRGCSASYVAKSRQNACLKPFDYLHLQNAGAKERHLGSMHLIG